MNCEKLVQHMVENANDAQEVFELDELEKDAQEISMSILYGREVNELEKHCYNLKRDKV